MGKLKRDAYTFQECFHDAMSCLTDESYGRIMRAINEFALYGNEPPPMNGMEAMIWKLVYPQLSKSRNKANGKAGAPRGNTNANKNNQNSIKIQSKNNQTTIKRQSTDNQKKYKEVPPSSPLEEIPPTPPKEEYPPIFPQENVYTQSSARERFEGWLKDNCPYIFKNMTLLTDAEFEKLKSKYSSEMIADVCSDIENRKDLRKRYTNLYRTLLNWLKKVPNGTDRTVNQVTAEERLNDAAIRAARLLAEDDAKTRKS